MTAPAERKREMRARRHADAVRDVRLFLPDARTSAVRARVAEAVARLDRGDEADALAWIESVAEFDKPHADIENTPAAR